MSSETSTKKTLRAALLEERQRLDVGAWRKQSDALCRHLAPWVLARGFKEVFFFASHRQEPDLSELTTLLPGDVTFALPVITGRGTMHFYAYESRDTLLANRHGILEPAPVEEVHVTPQSLILVPCAACDAQGFRLGYGGGFYDRFLAAHPTAMSLGVVFDRFFVATLPNEAHDQPLRGVATETGVRTFARKP